MIAEKNGITVDTRTAAPARKMIKCPQKTGINLNLQEDRQRDRRTLLIGILAIAALVTVVVNFGVLQQYRRLDKAQAAYDNINGQLQGYQAQLDEGKKQMYAQGLISSPNLDNDQLVVEAKAADASGFMVGKSEWAVPVGSLIDVEAELEKAKKELAHLEGFLTGVTKKLSNENFVAHAPAAVVEKERKKQADAMEKIAMVKAMIKALK